MILTMEGVLCTLRKDAWRTGMDTAVDILESQVQKVDLFRVIPLDQTLPTTQFDAKFYEMFFALLVQVSIVLCCVNSASFHL